MINKLSKTILAILLIGGLLAIFGCGKVITESTTPLETAETVEPIATTDISGVETDPIETDVFTGDVVWRVLDVSDEGESIVSADNYAFDAKRGKFIIIEFSVLNNSEDTKILYDLNVIDNKGRVFTLCLPAYGYISVERACAVTEIIPDNEYSFDAPFDVSPDSEGLILEVTDLSRTGTKEKAYIDLGI